MKIDVLISSSRRCPHGSSKGATNLVMDGLNTEDFELENESNVEYEDEISAPTISRAEIEERIRAQIASRLSFVCDHCEYATSIGTWLLKDLGD